MRTSENQQEPPKQAATEAAALGAIRFERGFDVDRLLLDVATAMRGEGFAVAGVVQQPYAPEKGLEAEMNLVDLASDQVIAISQDLGRHAKGCRLDQSKLTEVDEIVAQAISTRADLIVVNRFGRAEADGEGLVATIAAAVSAGIPVLTSVREPFVAPWRVFHGGMGSELPPDEDAVCSWCLAATT